MKRDMLLLITGTVLGVIGTTAASLLTGWFQAKEPLLVYEAKETLPLEDEGRSTAFYEVLLDNHGSKEAEGVVCVVKIPNAKLERHGVIHSPSMKSTEEVGEDSLTERFDAINPGDPVRISVLATSSESLPTLPIVSVRAKGVLGLEMNSAAEKNKRNAPATSLASQYLPLIVMPVFMSFMFSLYGLYSFVEKQVKSKFSVVRIEIKFPGEDQLKVRFGTAKEWITMISGSRHEGSGHNYHELRQMGEGKHAIQRK